MSFVTVFLHEPYQCNSKTSAIAKPRILVEQVIKRIKTFKILAAQMSISMLQNVDDIVLVCAAICNFKEPMYSD